MNSMLALLEQAAGVVCFVCLPGSCLGGVKAIFFFFKPVSAVVQIIYVDLY